MATVKIHKVNALPGAVEFNSLYAVSEGSDGIRFYFTGTNGNLKELKSVSDQERADLGTALQPPTFNEPSGTSYTMQTSDEGAVIEATDPSSLTLTLIQFSGVGAGFVFNQVSDASPTLGTLTGMTMSSTDIATFEALTQGQSGTFVCKIATPGAQVIRFI